MSSAAAATDPWGRRRLVRTLPIVAVVAALLLAGLSYAVYSAIASTRSSAAAASPGQEIRSAEQLPSGPARRDAIAAAPMLAVPPEASRSGKPSAQVGPTITIPPAGRVGPAGVPTGFPHSPEGAVAQLAAIETTVLQSMSIDRAHQVHAAWSNPGAVAAESWELTTNIQAFLASSAGQYAGDLRTAVVTTPIAAQVKGTDGTDWVLACVLLDVKAQIATQARIAYGHCERMQWTPRDGGRWVIGAGAVPARAPSTWPGTDLAIEAGWKTVTTPADQ